MRKRITTTIIGQPPRHRLTKRLYLTLRPGRYLVSNTLSEMVPMFAETVTVDEGQWRRICAAGANGRLCMLFDSPDGYKEWARVHLFNKHAQN